MSRQPRTTRISSISSVYSSESNTGSVFGASSSLLDSPRSPPSTGGFFDNAQGFGGLTEDPYAFALKAIYLAFLFDAAPKNRNLERRGSTASARPSILGLGSKLKRAKLPKDYSAALIEQLVGDLKSTSKEQGAEAKQWVATVSRFLALLEAKKALKKERNWSELLSAFTSCAVSCLPPHSNPTTFIERFALISTNASKNVLKPLDKEEKDILERLEAEMLAASPPSTGGSKKKITEWSKEEEEATKDLARMFSAEGRVRKDWAKLKEEIDEKNYHKDLNILLAQTSADPISVYRSRTLRKIDDLLVNLSELFPDLAPIPPTPLLSVSPNSKVLSTSPSRMQDPPPRPLLSTARRSSANSAKSSASSTRGGGGESPTQRHFTFASQRREAPTPPLLSSTGSFGSLHGVPAGVTFVPANPRGLMRELIEISHEREMERANGVETVLRKCGDAWMVTKLARRVLALEVAVERWESDQNDWEQPEGVRLALEDIAELGDLRNADEQECRHLDYHLTTLLSNLLSTLTGHFSLLATHSQNLPKHANFLSLLLPVLCSLLPASHPYLLDARSTLLGMATESYVVHATSLPLSNDNSLTIGSFELLTDWVEKTIIDLEHCYPVGELMMGWEPSGVALEKMLPLLLAEMSGLERVAPGGGRGEIFGLYERVGRLVAMWKRLCPKEDLGFDLDAFFTEHVVAWLDSTDEVEANSWVTRAVTADEWKPEGTYQCSSSVIDLFQSIRSSVKIVLVDLPLSPYPRAVYLVDLSKSASTAVVQYASTIEALFDKDIWPGATAGSLDASKSSGGWLSKILGGTSRKDGFMIPVKVCVKINDISIARSSLSDLLETMEPQASAEIIHRHNLARNPSASPGITTVNSNTYTVTVIRAEELFSKTKGSGKPADGFVVVHEGEKRLIKTKTVQDSSSPRFEQGFETSGTGVKTLEVTAMDRQAIGKHEPIGKATFVLNPRAFAEVRSQDLWLPLNPRGRVLVRIGMVGDLHDVGFYFARAERRLINAEQDMSRKVVDKLLEYARSVLSRQIVKDLAKSIVKKRKDPGRQLTDADNEIEQAITPLTTYLDANFLVFSQTFSDDVRNGVILALWKGLIGCLLDVLCPPLAIQSSTAEALSAGEVDIVFKWLKSLRQFFNASEDGVEHGIPLGQLHSSGGYRALILLSQNLDLPTDPLKENATLAVKAAARRLAWKAPQPTSNAMRRRSSGSSGLSANSSQRAGGTLESEERDEEKTAEVLLRILMTRSGTSDFVAHNIRLLNRAREQVAS